ncbi:MAG: hypothetical protein HYW25_05990 [Candidatus Aenigmarchaeota archaeon]|nr:hypothetical protein [Candidatus Aenigmarchaeota archaeon]
MLIMVSAIGVLNYTITGFASATQSTNTNVTIAAAISIALSTNLSKGIEFGTITLLPANQTNATANYANTTGGGGPGDLNITLYNVTLSSDSTENADFCVRANGDMCTSACSSRIGIANITWAANTTNNLTHPPTGVFRALFGRSMATGFDKGDINLAPGGVTHYRFWLNVSGAQAAGDYNNTVDFRAVSTGDACGS